MNLENMFQKAFLNVFWSSRKWSCHVWDEVFSVSFSEHFGPKLSWLLVRSVWVHNFMSPNSCTGWTKCIMEWAINGFCGPSVFFTTFNWSTLWVWFVNNGSSLVSINGSWTISLVIVYSCSVWAIDWDLVIVFTESMSVSIWIREKSSLEHFIVWWFNTGN